MNQPRRLEVLSAIVEDYVHSREPVGSKALVERHRLNVSSATVRNDMAALEEEGLIVAPHASAGRIPTDQGYRAFVDRIEALRPLSLAQRRAIEGFLDSSADLDEVMARTVRLLSQLTHQVAVVQYPQRAGERVRHLDLVSMAPDLVLVVIITTRGRVLQRAVPLVQDWSEEALARFRVAARSCLDGTLLDETSPREALDGAGLTEALDSVVEPALRADASALAETLLDLSTTQRQGRLVMAGTSYLAESTGDFGTSIAPILDVLEEQVVMLRLLAEIDEDARGVAVRIGRENLGRDAAGAPLADASVVATGYGPSGAAKLGVVGPTRMDYPTTMAAVRAVARYLSRQLRE